MAMHTKDDAAITLPAAVVEQLIGAGLQSPAGQLILTTVLHFHPTLKAAVQAADGQCHITAAVATLHAGPAAGAAAGEAAGEARMVPDG